MKYIKSSLRVLAALSLVLLGCETPQWINDWQDAVSHRAIYETLKETEEELDWEFLGQYAEANSTLSLAWSGLSELPPEIFEIPDLHELDLTGNDFASLPNELAMQADLAELYLGWNEFRAVSPVLYELPDLNYLPLHENNFTSMGPEFVGLSGLSYLSLANNKIREVDPSIGEMDNLRRLDLSHNQLLTLPETMANMEALGILVLRGNPISPEERSRIEALLPDVHVQFE